MSEQMIECPTCKGTGWLFDSEGEQCPTCTPKDGSQIGGSGMVPAEAPAEGRE